MPCPAPDPAPDRAPDRPPDLPPDLPRYAPDDPNGNATLCAPDDACDNCANGVFVEEGYPCGCEHPSMVLCNKRGKGYWAISTLPASITLDLGMQVSTGPRPNPKA
jgi:hypothetical protein